MFFYLTKNNYDVILSYVFWRFGMIYFLFYITVFFNLKYGYIPSNAIGASVVNSSELKTSLPQTNSLISKYLKVKFQNQKDDLLYHLFKKVELLQTFSIKSKQKKALTKENTAIFEDFFNKNPNVLFKTAVLFTKSLKNELLSVSSSIESDFKNKLINNTSVLFITTVLDKQKLFFTVNIKTNTAFAKEFTDMLNLLFSFASKEHLISSITGSGYVDEKTEKIFVDIASDVVYSLNFSYKDDLIIIKFNITVKKAEKGAKILADFKK